MIKIFNYNIESDKPPKIIWLDSNIDENKEYINIIEKVTITKLAG